MNLLLVPCELCGAEKFELMFPGTLVDPKPDDAGRYFSSSRFGADHPDIVRCTACGLVMANPRDDAETLSRVYAALADSAYDEDESSRRAAAKAQRRLLHAERPAPGRLLDLGCATGFFAASAHASGYDVTGVDASAWSIERARRRCPGATFQVGGIETLAFEAPFDVVTLWDVLEHVHAPREALSRVASWLKPGGSLLMSMPNAASLSARALGPHWVLLLREHLWYFSPQTIGQLLSECGFELVRTDVKWVRVSLAHITRRLSQYAGLRGALAAWTRPKMLKRASLAFPMGEINVVARRLP